MSIPSAAATAPAASIAGQFKIIPLASISESSTNPRKRFNVVKLAQMTESVRRKGVIEPIVVRPHAKPKGSIVYELVAGARRMRAATTAKLTDIPAMIRVLTDVDALELQIIENLDREDVHPLEEADGFRRLLSTPNYTIETLEEKIGHKPSYISKRLQLLKLTRRLQDDFLADKINISHALHLSRLPADKQDWIHKEELYRSESQHVDGKGWVEGEPHAISPAELKSLIHTQIFLDLAAAPWKKDDATLIPKAGACTACPKRTGANALLFDDLKSGDMCLDSGCFGSKADAHVLHVIKEKADDGVDVIRVSSHYLQPTDAKKLKAVSKNDYEMVADKGKKCGDVEIAVFIDGASRGQVQKICRNKSCRVHRPGHSSLAGKAEQKEDFWAVAARKLSERIKVAVRRQTVAEILARPMKWTIPHGQLQVLALSLLTQSTPIEVRDALQLPSAALQGKLNGSELSKELEKTIRAPQNSPAGDWLPRITVALSLQASVKEYFYETGPDAKLLKQAVESFGVNQTEISDRISQSMRDEFNARRARAKAKKKPAEPAAKAKK